MHKIYRIYGICDIIVTDQEIDQYFSEVSKWSKILSPAIFEKSENLGPTILSKSIKIMGLATFLRNMRNFHFSKKNSKISFKIRSCISHILIINYILYNIIHISYLYTI